MYRGAVRVENIVYHQKCWTAGNGASLVMAHPPITTAMPDPAEALPVMGGVGGVEGGAAPEATETGGVPLAIKTEKDGSAEV